MDLEGLRRVDPGFRKGPGGLSFSKTEIVHIAVALIVLSIAFTVMLYRGGSHLDNNTLVNIAEIFLVSMLLITCSFLIHEMGHKYVAQSYGAWSEFRMFPAGLLMALVFSFMGFLFAAPGAVYIRGNINKEQNGIISMAGPVMNFIVGAIALILTFMTSGLTSSILFQLAWINAFLGIFNMIPIPPMDGSKVLSWDIRVFLTMAAIGIAELAILYSMW